MYSVYGKHLRLSKLQMRAWARFAQRERDLFFFALPLSLALGGAALYSILGTSQTVELIAVLLAFSCVMGLISLALGTKHLHLILSFSESRQQIKKRRLQLLRFSLPKRYQFIAGTWNLGAMTLLALLGNTLAVVVPHPPWLLQWSTVAVLWVCFEVIVRSWNQRQKYLWLDTLVFSDLESLFYRSIESAALAGLILSLHYFLLTGNVVLSLLCFLAPVLSIFFCFHGGQGFATYQRLYFLAALALSWVLMSWHPVASGIILWLLLANASHAIRQMRLTYTPQQFPQ